MPMIAVVENPRTKVAIGYMEAVAENLMRLDCPPGEHHPAVCPRCQASIHLAKALRKLDELESA